MKSNSLWVLMISLSGVVVSGLLAADGNVEARLLMEEIVATQHEREQLYGNMHAVWLETRVQADGSENVNTIEFWARADQYYRVDIRPQANNSESGPTVRTIVRPDRYARLSAKGRDDLGAVFEFGGVQSLDEGMKWIRGDAWCCQANKAANKQTHEMISNWRKGTSMYKQPECLRSVCDLKVSSNLMFRTHTRERCIVAPIRFRLRQQHCTACDHTNHAVS